MPPFDKTSALKHNAALEGKPDAVSQWVNVANSVYDRCVADGGESVSCEAKAIQQANGVVKQRLFEENVQILVPIELEENEEPKPVWQPIMYTGEFDHSAYGKFKVTKEDLENAVKVFESGALGTERSSNYQHASHDRDPEKAKASGWIKKLRVVGDKLEALWEPTRRALQFIRNKEFKFVSPEFVRNWKDENGQERGFTVLGFAVTNVNFLKKRAIPLALTEERKYELFGDTQKKTKKAANYRETEDAATYCGVCRFFQRDYEWGTHEQRIYAPYGSCSLVEGRIELQGFTSDLFESIQKPQLSDPDRTQNLQDFTTAEWDGSAVRTRLDQEDLIKVIPPAAAQYVRKVARDRDIAVADVPKAEFYFPVRATPGGPINVNALRAVLGGRGAQAQIPEPFKTQAQDWVRQQFQKWRDQAQAADVMKQVELFVAEAQSLPQADRDRLVAQFILSSDPSGANPNQGGVEMKLTQTVRERLGLPEDATQEQFEAAVEALLGKAGKIELSDEVRQLLHLEEATADAVEAAIKKLADEARKDAGKVQMTEEEIAQLKAKAEAGERAERQLKERQRDELLKEALDSGKFHASELDAETDVGKYYRDMALNEPDKFRLQMDGRKVHPDFKEIGSSGGTETSGEPQQVRDRVTQEFMTEAGKLAEERKIDLADAILLMESEKPDLYKRYKVALGDIM